MKRSKMHSNLTVALCTYPWPKVEGEQGIRVNELAEFILNEIEKLGMKPPEALFNGNHTGCLCTMRESCPSCGGWCNEWEQE